MKSYFTLPYHKYHFRGVVVVGVLNHI